MEKIDKMADWIITPGFELTDSISRSAAVILCLGFLNTELRMSEMTLVS